MRAVSFDLFKICLFCLLLQLSGTCILKAQLFHFNGPRKTERIAFDLVRNLVIIPLYINGKGPFRFILDTGVSPMIITDTAVLRDLNLQKLRTVKISGLGTGIELDALLTNQINVRIGNAVLEEMPTAILKQDVLGLSNYVGTRVYGLIGYHFFNSFVAEISYTGRRLKFRLPDKRKKIKGEPVPIQILNGKPYTNLCISMPDQQSLQVKVVIDNGASHAISLESLEGAAFPLPAHSIPANLGVGLGGPIKGNIGRIPALEIGNFRLENVISSYPIYDDAGVKALLLNRNGNLGAEVLSRFNVTFDYSNNLMYLKQNANFKRAFNHDMSGMELYVEEHRLKQFYIGRLEPGSPAEEAGLQIGDEILSINFVNTSALDLNDITRYLRSENGKSLHLFINRAGDLLIKTIKLKKRI